MTPSELPLVSIVTPVYQMAEFVGETIESVLAQDYPHIEYIVMDGGSTDGTVDVLKKYQGSARVKYQWFSGADNGTADAINKGIARSAGSIVAYLNADDTYCKGAVSAAVEAFVANPDVDVVYGDGEWVGENGSVIERYPTRAFDAQLLQSECFICQPTAFVRRSAFETAGAFDTSVRYAYDYDFWIRLAKQHRFLRINRTMATSRMHAGNKTLHQRRGVLRENIALLKRHYDYVPFGHILAYSAHIIDGRDQFFSPLRPSIPKYLLSLPLGWRYNGQHPLRYTREWAAAMSLSGLRRRLSGMS